MPINFSKIKSSIRSWFGETKDKYIEHLREKARSLMPIKVEEKPGIDEVSPVFPAKIKKTQEVIRPQLLPISPPTRIKEILSVEDKPDSIRGWIKQRKEQETTEKDRSRLLNLAQSGNKSAVLGQVMSKRPFFQERQEIDYSELGITNPMFLGAPASISSQLIKATKVIENSVVRNFVRQAGYMIGKHSQTAWQLVVNSASQFKDIKEVSQAAEHLKLIIPKSEQTKAMLKDIAEWTKSSAVSYKSIGTHGFVMLGPLTTIGTGMLAAASWAYPAKKLGEYLGWKIEEKKAGRRLRP